MTTPEEPETSTPPAEPEELELIRHWRERAELAWPDSVPAFEFLHGAAWVDPPPPTFPEGMFPMGVRALGFIDRGTDRGPLLEVRCRDAVRAFEGALWALPRIMPAGTPPDPDHRPPGALTKLLERSELLDRVEALELIVKRVRRVDNLHDALAKRVETLEQALPADVRVLVERIEEARDELSRRIESCDGSIDTLEARVESDRDVARDAVRDLEAKLLDKLERVERAYDRRLDRLEGDVDKLERRR